MTFEDIEVPQFSEQKPIVVDAAVRKNPAKWRERNKRRAQSRKASRPPQGGAHARSTTEPSWEVQQTVPTPEVADLKKQDLQKDHEKECEDAPEDESYTQKPQGKTMPGGYYVRSLEEVHMSTMRALNVRLTKPYQRTAASCEEEDLPPLEPEEMGEVQAPSPGRVVREAAKRAQAAVREAQKQRRQDEEEERRREAERRLERRRLELKIRKLKEEQEVKEAQEEARRKEWELQQLAEQEAGKNAPRAGNSEPSENGGKDDDAQKELRRQRRAQRDAEEDAKLREARRRRRAEEEAAKKELEEAQRAAEEEKRQKEKERKEREKRERKEREKAEAAAEAQRRQEDEARRAADEQRRREEAEHREALLVAARQKETAEETLRRQQMEMEERRRRAEQRRKEIKEKAERAKKAAAAGLPPSAAAALAAEAVARDAKPPTAHVTVAVLGHHGAGKSMLVGALLLATGAVSERDLAKRRKEAERLKDESQREDGLRTPKGAELALLDVPGGRRSLPQAVAAAAEADVALLVVSAKGRELEAALKEAGGGPSTLAEQLRAARGLGTAAKDGRLAVAVTKMDEVSWAQDRFDEVIATLTPVLTNAGFSQAATVFVPVDGLTNQVDGRKASWHTGSSLLQCLDDMASSSVPRPGALQVLVFESTPAAKGAVRVRGRVEQGTLRPGERCLLAPGSAPCTVEVLRMAASRNVVDLQEAKSGQNVELQLSGGPFPDWPAVGSASTIGWCGAVLGSAESPVEVSETVKAYLEVLELPRPMTAGFKAVLHVHAATVDAEIEEILDATDWATGVTTERPKIVKAGQRLTVVLKFSRQVPVCSVSDAHCSRLGLLMLRLEETTVAVGHVLEVR
ncbi:SUP35 [Symbiodinium natans]|uniref:SUP35 protein n=1 Tax=Symbiodinium natans TaxID=878477 RepID=A0A812J6T3_9DINO|nr:SUP35 [Symbiodinium natans]